MDCISGDEVQRLAIALILLKKADVYLFDDISTYLDVEMRNTVAYLIKRIVFKYIPEAAIVVIDHDKRLMTLLCDDILSLKPKLLKFLSLRET